MDRKPKDRQTDREGIYVLELLLELNINEASYQGVCNILDSFILPGTMSEALLYIKFNSSRPLMFYSLFPGKKTFLSVYHPTGSLEGIRIEGAAMFKLWLLPKVVSLLSDSRNCDPVENDGIITAANAQKEYDQWYVKF